MIVTEAEFEFQSSYRIVRKRVLKGLTTVADAKLWLKKHADITASRIITARQELMDKGMMSERADRELDLIRKAEAQMAKEDEGDKDE